ncbi:MAG: TonB-dependent receptor, partial [Bacteroidota bacterium]
FESYFVRPENFWTQEPGGILADTIRQGEGQSILINAYSRSQFVLSRRWKLNIGLHLMYLAESGEASLEPRLGIRYQLTPKQSLSFGYGLHSQMEPYFTYIVQRQSTTGNLYRYNEDIRFNKSHHFVLSHRWQPTERLRLGVEMYYQHLFNMVVGENLPISRVGGLDYYFSTIDLNNGGVGRNMGIEFALERSFAEGYYFLFNGSLFDANYTPNDQITRPSRFNNRFITNGVLGKEWKVGKKRGRSNLLNANLSATYSGPRYYTPFDLELALTEGVLQTDYLNPNSGVQDPLIFLDASIVFQRNRPKTSTQLALQVKNILNQRPLLRQAFNRETMDVLDIYGSGILPVLLWKIQF